MRRMGSIALVMLCLSLSVLGQEAPQKPLPLPKPPEDPGFSGDRHNARFSAGPALGAWNGSFGFGGDVSLSFRFADDVPVYVGVLSGFHTFSTSVRTNSVPVLATLLYRVRVADSNFTPYVGAAGGIGILFASGVTTAVRFEGFGRVGAEFELDRQTSVYVEPRFGVLDGRFLFLGALGVTFSF